MLPPTTLVLRPTYKELMQAMASVSARVSHLHPVKWKPNCAILTDLQTGERWFFITTNPPYNINKTLGQVFTEVDGAIPDLWRAVVLSHVRQEEIVNES